MALFTVRSERLEYDLLFKWLLDRNAKGRSIALWRPRVGG